MERQSERIGVIALFTLLAIGSSTQLSGLSTPPSVSQVTAANPTGNTVTMRDVFYTSNRFGFRFVSPSGYTIVPAQKLSGQPTTVQVLEIWNQADYLNSNNLPESPPIISITIYNNSQKLPLARWKGQLSRNDDRPLTIAGQRAIAYTSTGLYESDNVLFSSPDNRYVFRLLVAYINKSDRIRQVFQQVVNSFTFDILNPSQPVEQWRINYSNLQNFLNQRNWQAADVETRGIMFRLVDGKGDLLFDSKTVLAQLPCEDLRTIDRLWSTASQRRFGYSAQQRIWQQISSRTNNSKQRVERFGQAVGWRRNTPLPENNPVGMELTGIQWKLDTELNYTANAPVGHFPWVGVSSTRLSDYLSERSAGCGSCTIDAMNLASERFNNYLPALFTRLKTCRVS
ncbi:GUN4 domain-containing protein [Planktothrix sp. FACHB-1355]|uniref:GUN4 domain-containing protein n=1 Tax=Aerosakkonema funiforme FACHB-1375 TaxID=2949571 RepID=A0A926V9L4_9CYAN|nr:MULTISPECIES: GUN4 domain-containing protein [Oscillatoriales]MBD2179635.1 GUN4 domain-containing protein [Aerosakkonema funiforme FACHB-1375]MBD3559328.1 GUN4 domain-containing protein [Planktothrix sp. FACHB-1355]